MKAVPVSHPPTVDLLLFKTYFSAYFLSEVQSLLYINNSLASRCYIANMETFGPNEMCASPTPVDFKIKLIFGECHYNLYFTYIFNSCFVLNTINLKDCLWN